NDAGSDVIDHGRSAGELMRKPDREHLWPGVSRPKVLPHNPGWTTARIGQRRVKHIARAALVVAYRVARRERGGRRIRGAAQAIAEWRIRAGKAGSCPTLRLVRSQRGIRAAGAAHVDGLKHVVNLAATTGAFDGIDKIAHRVCGERLPRHPGDAVHSRQRRKGHARYREHLVISAARPDSR